MENQTKQEIKFWAIVELMGHQKIAGELTEFVMGGASFIRVDVPETETQQSFTRLLSDKAIYAINPVSEDVARFKSAQLQVQPIESWDFNSMLKKQMEQRGLNVARDPSQDANFGDDDENPF